MAGLILGALVPCWKPNNQQEEVIVQPQQIPTWVTSLQHTLITKLKGRVSQGDAFLGKFDIDAYKSGFHPNLSYSDGTYKFAVSLVSSKSSKFVMQLSFEIKDSSAREVCFLEVGRERVTSQKAQAFCSQDLDDVINHVWGRMESRRGEIAAWVNEDEKSAGPVLTRQF
ncbi:hypothetical protein [Chitinimonas lacunae]|uniref:Secreted protein n=1 Tax=Chitinimonas lacunae TaxID=1963018 RepID=A0ABV8MLY2_9NEIS